MIPAPAKRNQPLSASGRGLRFCGMRVAVDAVRAEPRTLAVENGRFAVETVGPALDLGGLIALPGLINAHDHLEFALFPRLGVERRYRNAREWAESIYRPDESPIREHLRVPKADRLQWGALRNLLSGVTTVCHHNPYEAEVFETDFPVRVVREMGWAHSLSFGGEAAARFAETPREWPFVVHAAEGIDEEARAEIQQLDELGVLSDRTVLVHATACGDAEWDLLERRGCGIVWCPLSNVFLFGRTLLAEHVLRSEAIALGTDSSLTAVGGMFEAFGCAAAQGVPPPKLYSMVTGGPARILRLPSGAGTLAAGAPADWIALRDHGCEPCEALLGEPELELAVGGGVAMLVSDSLAEAYPQLAEGMTKLTYWGSAYWVRTDVPALLARARAELGEEVRLGGGPVEC